MNIVILILSRVYGNKILIESTIVIKSTVSLVINFFLIQVVKVNIEVRFFQMKDDEVIWEALGDFSQHNVHHQVAISFRTPPYFKSDVSEAIDCFIELRRPSDDARSNSLKFQFVPDFKGNNFP